MGRTVNLLHSSWLLPTTVDGIRDTVSHGFIIGIVMFLFSPLSLFGDVLPKSLVFILVFCIDYKEVERL